MFAEPKWPVECEVKPAIRERPRVRLLEIIATGRKEKMKNHYFELCTKGYIPRKIAIQFSYIFTTL